MMDGCTHKHDCPLFNEFSMNGAVKIWRLMYCDKEKKFPTCARFRAAQQGETIPLTLLPNGQHLKLEA